MTANVMSRAEVRAIDERAIREFEMPGVLLMENAGRGAVDVLESLGIGGPIVLCAGKGNNGGDAFVMARHLENRGHEVSVLLCCDPEELQGDALVNYRILLHGRTPLSVVDPVDQRETFRRELQRGAWIVDALLGTGTRGSVREPFSTAIGEINAAGRRVLSVDLPSGLDCDTGQPLGCCVRADHTVTFVARKLGFDQPGADAWTGEVHVVEIGVPRRLLESSD